MDQNLFRNFLLFSATNSNVESKYVVANGWNIFLQETWVLVPAIILINFWYKVLWVSTGNLCVYDMMEMKQQSKQFHILNAAFRN
jgi:hypothetical protein